MKTKKARLLILSTLATLVCLGCFVLQVSADDTLKYKFTTWQVKAETAPAYDLPGHIVFLGTRGALFFFENGDVATVNISTMSDMSGGKGPFWQYVNIKFPDKSTIVIKSQGYFGGDVGNWKSEIIKGTGRFEGVKGTQEANATFFPLEKGEGGPRGYGEGSITYTLPSK